MPLNSRVGPGANSGEGYKERTYLAAPGLVGISFRLLHFRPCNRLFNGMNQTGHRSVQMVRRYIRDGSLFREDSAGKLGL
jgi:hypothetical protein